MRLIHKLRTQAEEKAIHKTLTMLRAIRPEQFDMSCSLESEWDDMPPAECNSYGCIAGHCVVANVGNNTFDSGDLGTAEIEAAEIMGLDTRQSNDLFTPDTPDADYDCKDPKDPRHITHRRGILALWYFAQIGVVQWNNERLEKYVASRPMPILRGVEL